MTDDSSDRENAPKKRDLLKKTLLFIPMFLLLALFLFGAGFPADPLKRVSLVLTFVFLNLLFWMMLDTDSTYRYRKMLFVSVAFLFAFSFIPGLIEVRGSMLVKSADMLAGAVPFCHIVIPMVIVPALFTKTIIFPGSILTGFASIASMIVIWAGASLALGRGWCSWICFYGGFDEGFSSISGKPVIKKIDRKWTYLPYAMLLGVVLISSITLSAVYCPWICPFKAVSEFHVIDSMERLIQAIIFISLFIALVIVLPILTKRRTQCSFLCPFSAFQSFTNWLNVFDIRIDTEKCVHCHRCVKECPTFSIDEESVKKGVTRLSCTKCGKCVDICPKKAASFHVKGTDVGQKPGLARLLFLFPAFLFGAVYGAGTISDGLWRILKFITTGSFIGR